MFNMGTDFFYWIRKAFAFVFGFVNSALFYFLPVWQLVEVLFILFVASYGIGLVYSIRFQHEDLSKTKTFKAITEFTVYVMLIAGFFIIGERMRADNMIMRFIEIITWGLIYIYTTNIFKNLTRMLPHARGLKWVYFVLNLEFIKRLPMLGEFNDKEDDNK